jgi:conjugative relaxase-like TrwC/TraI family protein
MVTVTPLKEKDVEGSSKEFFTEEFRTRRRGTFGYWMGNGAKYLQLENPVCQEHFQNLAYGLTPDGSQKVVPDGGDPNRLASWRITFDGSQSLSVLWALAPERERDKIESAFLTTVAVSLERFEHLMTERQTKLSATAGQSPIFTLFSCGASWDQCPHLNATVFLLNHAIRQDGSAQAYNAGDILGEQAKLKWLYEGGLDYFVWKAIGPFQRVEAVDELRIKGVPQELVTKLFFDPAFGTKRTEGLAPTELLPNEALFSKWQKQAELAGWIRKEATDLLSKLHREQILANIASECWGVVRKGKFFLERVWGSLNRDGDGGGDSKNPPDPGRSKEQEHTHSR